MAESNMSRYEISVVSCIFGYIRHFPKNSQFRIYLSIVLCIHFVTRVFVKMFLLRAFQWIFLLHVSNHIYIKYKILLYLYF